MSELTLDLTALLARLAIITVVIVVTSEEETMVTVFCDFL